MKKINLLLTFFTLIVIPNILYADAYSSKYKAGKGEFYLTDDMANIVEYYFSGGKKGAYAQKQDIVWKPGVLAIAIDSSDYSYFRNPMHVDSSNIDNKNYAGRAIKDCEKRSGTTCYTFAIGYKIVWDNGSDKKRRKLKRKEIKAGKTLSILQELGFYKAGYSDTSSSTSSSTSSTDSNSSKSSNLTDEMISQLKALNELYKSGVLTEEEFKKAKKKILD